MKLVKDVKDAWRWYSMRAMGVALGIQGAWMALGNLQSRIPNEWVDVMTIIILISGIIGRVVDQKGSEP